MTEPPRIILADLYHDTGARAVPVGVALLAAYLQAQPGNRCAFTLADTYAELLRLAGERRPALVGFSVSVRNWRLTQRAARRVRQLLPDALIVIGGPSVWRFKGDSERFTREQPEADVAVYGYGELPFAELLARWQDDPAAFARPQREQLAAATGWELLPGGCLYLHRALPPQLGALPSPYLTGLLDRFITPAYWQVFETNRGCPNACGYCTYSIEKRLHEFPLARIYDEFDYVRRRCDAGMWIIADANFGLAERDLEIAAALRQRLEGSRITLVYTNSCNQVERMNRLSEILAPVSSHSRFAVQSFDPAVLQHINRWVPSEANITEAVSFHHRHGLPIKIDLILGLPGATLASQLDSLRTAFRLGFDFIEWFELWLLRGTIVDSPDFHRRFAYRVKYRARMAFSGVYDGNRIIEYEENPVATAEMSEAEYHYLRLVNWVRWFGFNFRFLGLPFAVLHESGGDPVTFITGLLAPTSGGELAAMVADFLEASRAEWFDSPAVADAHYADPARIRDHLTLNPKYLGRLIREAPLRREFLAQVARALRTALPPEVTDETIAAVTDFTGRQWLTEAELLAVVGGAAPADRSGTLRGAAARAAARLYRLPPPGEELTLRLTVSPDQQTALRRELRDYAAAPLPTLVRCILATYDPHLMQNLLQRQVVEAGR